MSLTLHGGSSDVEHWQGSILANLHSRPVGNDPSPAHSPKAALLHDLSGRGRYLVAANCGGDGQCDLVRLFFVDGSAGIDAGGFPPSRRILASRELDNQRRSRTPKTGGGQ